jgi:protein SCO1/2
MPRVAATGALSEPQFAALVDQLSFDPTRQEDLTELLRENHPVYNQRGGAATVRMRGWVLIALARVGLSDNALLFVLEELDTGRDAYLVAAAARALRSYAGPVQAFAPFIMRAITNIRYHDEPVIFNRYGEYATSATGITAVSELLTTLRWLGPRARAILPELKAFRTNRGGFSKNLLREINRTVKTLANRALPDEHNTHTCCTLPVGLGNALCWPLGSRRGCEAIESTVFEDHNGIRVTFEEFFRGHPSIVVFFYTRCDNPQKCSLTITKLARVQKLLVERGLATAICTAAITYDPAFDLSNRLRGYGNNRGVYMNAHHRMLRTINGISALCSHFKLGVNFVESLVNRHRVELYILDAAGGIAASFERIQWDEQQIVNRAVDLLNEKSQAGAERHAASPRHFSARHSMVLPVFGGLSSLGLAFFPRCPACWAAYMSVLGIAGLDKIPYSPWLQPILFGLMLLNLLVVWLRGRATRRMSAFFLVTAGAIAIIASKMGLASEHANAWGVALTLVGSLSSTLSWEKLVSVFFLRQIETRT